MHLTTRREFVSFLGASALGARSSGGGSQQPSSLSGFAREFPALRQHVNGQPLNYLDSAATSTLGKRPRPRVLTHTESHQRIPDQRLPAISICFGVSP